MEIFAANPAPHGPTYQQRLLNRFVARDAALPADLADRTDAVAALVTEPPAQQFAAQTLQPALQKMFRSMPDKASAGEIRDALGRFAITFDGNHRYADAIDAALGTRADGADAQQLRAEHRKYLANAAAAQEVQRALQNVLLPAATKNIPHLIGLHAQIAHPEIVRGADAERRTTFTFPPVPELGTALQKFAELHAVIKSAQPHLERYAKANKLNADALAAQTQEHGAASPHVTDVQNRLVQRSARIFTLAVVRGAREIQRDPTLSRGQRERKLHAYIDNAVAQLAPDKPALAFMHTFVTDRHFQAVEVRDPHAIVELPARTPQERAADTAHNRIVESILSEHLRSLAAEGAEYRVFEKNSMRPATAMRPYMLAIMAAVHLNPQLYPIAALRPIIASRKYAAAAAVFQAFGYKRLLAAVTRQSFRMASGQQSISALTAAEKAAAELDAHLPGA